MGILDSGLRRNDGTGAGMTVEGLGWRLRGEWQNFNCLIGNACHTPPP